MTPDEANQERRDAAIRRSRRIIALDDAQLENFIHRVAQIEPAVVDRILDEFDANLPKPRTEQLLHPVTFYGTSKGDVVTGLMAYCELDRLWHEHVEDGSGLAELERVVRQHSGITT